MARAGLFSPDWIHRVGTEDPLAEPSSLAPTAVLPVALECKSLAGRPRAYSAAPERRSRSAAAVRWEAQ